MSWDYVLYENWLRLVSMDIFAKKSISSEKQSIHVFVGFPRVSFLPHENQQMSFMVHFACLEDFWHVKTGCPWVSIES